MSKEQTAAIQKVTRNKLAVRERQKTALELRLGGDTFQVIADKLGCSKHTAHSLYEKAMDATIKEPAARIREAELLRLDGMFAGFWPTAQKGDPVAAADCLKIMEHRAKLLGLFALPEQQDEQPRVIILKHAHELEGERKETDVVISPRYPVPAFEQKDP